MTFWRIYHSLVRQDDSEEEIARATKACMWLAENAMRIRPIITIQQIEILTQVNMFWYTQKSAPSHVIIKETLERKSTVPGILEILSEYDEQEGLIVHSPEDLGQLLEDLIEEWQTERLKAILKTSNRILNGVYRDAKKKEYKGPKSAIKYLIEQIETGRICSSGPPMSGALNETIHEVMDLYEKYEADRLIGSLHIRTGVPQIDQHIAIKRGDFVGVLGYAGQRKSSLCRTIAYNAARQGFNVLHVSLEQTYDEERIIYALMHSTDAKFANLGFTKQKFDSGDMTEEQKKYLRNVIIPDFEQNLPGRLIVRQPVDGTSWHSIKTIAEVTNQTTPIDLFFIDYLTLTSTTSLRESKAEMEQNIKDAKQFAMGFDGGRGLVFLTPIQGNRKGYEEATNTGGLWDMTGVYEYSEFEKSADWVLSTFMDAPLIKDNKVIISSVKTRRAQPLPLIEVPVDVTVGMFCPFSMDTPTAIKPSKPGGLDIHEEENRLE